MPIKITRDNSPEARQALFRVHWASFPEPLKAILHTIGKWPDRRSDNYTYLVGWCSAAAYYNQGRPPFDVGYVDALGAFLERGDPWALQMLKDAT